MWKITNIKISNIVSFKDAELSIEQGVATLIFGKNLDNEAQPCNGSGKSSLVEAISFALTGEQLRKVKSIEEIIRDEADDAWVQLTLDNDYDGTRFVIERSLRRGASQVIACSKFDSDGNEIEKDKTAQPTVLDYNRYILSEIGLSKDDIYNTFILCDNKYEGFFEAPDKSKKEVINRFCNGALVDEGIERIHQDLEPAEEALEESKCELSRVAGSIAAINRELEGVDDKNADAKKQREDQIAETRELIRKCRESIDSCNLSIEHANSGLTDMEAVRAAVGDLENKKTGVLESYDKIQRIFSLHGLRQLSDYDLESRDLTEKIKAQEARFNEGESALKQAKETFESAKKDHEALKEEFDAFERNRESLDNDDAAWVKKISSEMEGLDGRLDVIEKDIASDKRRINELLSMIAGNEALLKGAVECPKCSHRFVVADERSIDAINTEISNAREEISKVKEHTSDLNSRFDKIDDEFSRKIKERDGIRTQIADRAKEADSFRGRITNAYNAVSQAASAERRIAEMHSRNSDAYSRLSSSLSRLCDKLYGEAGGIIDSRVGELQRKIEQAKSTKAYEEGRMNRYRESLDVLQNSPIADYSVSLKESLSKYYKEQEKVMAVHKDLEKERDVLKEQEQIFVSFKSYIARKKIDALSAVVNDFLEKIGSDIRLRLEGFSMTKTGKLRDKISVQVTRDGVDCGSYYKFSGGERARLNLASILALHHLVNSDCEKGKGLDFLIIDELLDKSDEVGMSMYCEALNNLGQTALLITQGAVAESYAHKLLITKQYGISKISG